MMGFVDKLVDNLVGKVKGLAAPWLWGAGIALALSLATGLYLKGRTDAKARCEAAELRLVIQHKNAAILALQRQVQANNEALRRANARAQIAQDNARQLEEKADAFEDDIRARGGDCAVSDDDALRLRDLR